MFSLMNLLILKPLPYPASDELVRIHRTNAQNPTANHSASDYLELARVTGDFAQLATYRQWGYTMSPEGRAPVNLNALRVSASFLTTLGLKPEVVFFLTDADLMTNNDVNEILAEAGSSRIQTVEFGHGPDLGENTPLRRMATTTGGSA